MPRVYHAYAQRWDSGPLATIRDDPDAFGTHTRVRTGLIPIDGGHHRRQP